MKTESITWNDPKEQLPPFIYHKIYGSGDDIDELWDSDTLLVESVKGNIMIGLYERMKSPQDGEDESYDHADFVVCEYPDPNVHVNDLEIDEVTAWAYLPKGSKGEFDERDNDAE